MDRERVAAYYEAGSSVERAGGAGYTADNKYAPVPHAIDDVYTVHYAGPSVGSAVKHEWYTEAPRARACVPRIIHARRSDHEASEPEVSDTRHADCVRAEAADWHAEEIPDSAGTETYGDDVANISCRQEAGDEPCLDGNMRSASMASVRLVETRYHGDDPAR